MLVQRPQDGRRPAAEEHVHGGGDRAGVGGDGVGGGGVTTLNGIRSSDGVVLDEDQARWFGPLLAVELGARVL